jgi:hypothetical protein
LHGFRTAAQVIALGRRRFAGQGFRIAACMHKLLTILNAMLRDQKRWDAAKHVHTPLVA